MKTIKKYTLLFISLLFASLNFNLILNPLNLVTGGTQGLAILITHIFELKPSTIILIINITALIVSYFFLTKENTYSALTSTFVYPLFIKLTSSISSLTIIKNHILIFTIIAGIICGITGGYIYKLGFSSGGITIINLLLKKYFKLKISVSNFIINTIIIILGYFHFGLTKALYSIIVITISSILIYSILKKRKTN